MQLTNLVENKYSKMYLKYIYFMLSILQIYLHIYNPNSGYVGTFFFFL